MSREWTPGDVAMMTIQGQKIRAIYSEDRGAGAWLAERFVKNGRGSEQVQWIPADIKDARPLVVIDPEDRAQVERLWALYRDSKDLNQIDGMRSALREFANPTPPEVLEHFITRVDQGGVSTSFCGKVWRRSDDVTVSGRCEACEEGVKAGWSA